MENRKILYSLGCTCDPHLSWQLAFRDRTAPSLFAGLIQLQEESDFFIPQTLFDGTLEKFFFSKDEWERIEQINVKNFRNIYKTASGKFFKYCANLQTRKNIDASLIDLKTYVVVNSEIYYNDKLHLLNVHAKNKTPGINPMFTEYQEKKYEFFLEHKFDLKFGIYLHRSVSEQQLEEFQNLILKQNLDCKNFVVFIRSKETFQNVKFNKIFLQHSDDEQNNSCYSSQRKAMVDFAKANFI